MEIEQASEYSIRNRDKVLGEICGCYHCMHTFNGDDVLYWTDGGQTALCPNCRIDAVIPGQTNGEFLRMACKHWFTDHSS